MSNRSILILATIASATIGTTPASAQSADSLSLTPRKGTWELVIPSGSLLPTGAQRNDIKRGSLTAVQLSYVPRPSLAFTATVGWARTRDLSALESPRLNVFTYDVGAELRAQRRPVAKSMTFMPFAGVGAGARSYDYRSLDVDASHHATAYASAGGEFGVRRVRLRIDVRDYVSGSKSLARAGDSSSPNGGTRNDIVVMAGLRLVRR